MHGPLIHVDIEKSAGVWENMVKPNKIFSNSTTVNCGYETPNISSLNLFDNNNNHCFLKNDSFCLFNITDDPCEINDISMIYPEIVNELQSYLQFEFDSQVTPIQETCVENPMAADPLKFYGFWVPWNDTDSYLLESPIITTTTETPATTPAVTNILYVNINTDNDLQTGESWQTAYKFWGFFGFFFFFC